VGSQIPSLRVEDFFELDFGRGVLRNKHDKRRVFIIGAKAFRTIQEGLYARFSTSAGGILHQMGRSYGEALAGNQLLSEQDTHVGIIADLQVLAKVAGWGKISINGDFLLDDEVKLIVDDCVFCTATSSSNAHVDKPRCHFLVGIVQGIVDRLFPEQFIASESKCMYLEDVYCEITLLRKNQR
jgi:predicted hydrocarbon binding protein